MPRRQTATTPLARLDAASLFAWGTLTMDALRRDPETRAAMLARQGFRRVAIDWRYAQLENLDAELAALRGRGIEAIAVWAPILLYPGNDEHIDRLFGFIERNALEIALWSTLMQPYDFETWAEAKKMDRTCEAVGRIADRASEHGCNVALYNYDGWFARPGSLRKVVTTMERPNVGIVYNFHHAERDIGASDCDILSLLPWLDAVNLGGVTPRASGVRAFGEGQLEFEMLAALLDAGYSGPLGITSFDASIDASECLSRGLDGLTRFRRSIETSEN